MEFKFVFRIPKETTNVTKSKKISIRYIPAFQRKNILDFFKIVQPHNEYLHTRHKKVFHGIIYITTFLRGLKIQGLVNPF